MSRDRLERLQVWLYLAAIAAGLGVDALLRAAGAPQAGAALEALIWPALGLLLFATFTQIPLARLRDAFRDGRFMAAALIGNFILLPSLVWGLLVFAPDDPALRLGIALVLLVPCTDWFIAFAHMGGGDARRAVALTPLNLLAQLALLPVYLWLLMGEGFTRVVGADQALAAVLLIGAPLALAFLVQRWAKGRPQGERAIAWAGWTPVFLLAAVIFLIAASQGGAMTGALDGLGRALGVFAGFLVAAPLIAIALGRAFRLPAAQTRTLVFSFATRNCFVVLPFALALGAGWEAAAFVIIAQSLVELFAMAGYVRLVPLWVR